MSTVQWRNTYVRSDIPEMIRLFEAARKELMAVRENNMHCRYICDCLRRAYLLGKGKHSYYILVQCRNLIMTSLDGNNDFESWFIRLHPVTWGRLKAQDFLLMRIEWIDKIIRDLQRWHNHDVARTPSNSLPRRVGVRHRVR